MINAIIFDFDGVLVESVEIKTMAFAKLFESEGQNLVKKVISYHLQHTGVSRFEKFRYIYKYILNRELSKEEFQTLCQKFSRSVVDDIVKSPYVNGVKEFLDACTVQYKYFVVSATPQDEIEEIIKRRSILHYFAGIYGAPKKKSEIVREIIINNNLLSREIVYVGDALSDYEAAKANSVNFIARINNNDGIFNDIYCIKVRDLLNLKDIIESNFG